MMFTCLSAGLASSWALLFLFDLIIFGMTLYRTLKFSRSNNANMLITVFMRDGELIVGQLQKDFSESLRLTGAMYFGCARVSSANDCCYLMWSP